MSPNPFDLWNLYVVRGIFVNALLFLYDQLAGIGVANWGVAIIVFTIIVKSLTLPLTLKSLQSTRRMQAMQPHLQQLQKQYKNDKERLMQEQMALYKEHGVNPVAGCLPMIIQMPIWIALYRALYDLAGDPGSGFTQPFLWIQNLGLPEFTTANFPHQLPILAVLTALTQWLTSRMAMQQTQDAQQQAMNSAMQFMPLMFLFFSLSVPAGLVLYWVTSNLYQMVQQYFVSGWGGLAPLVAGITSRGSAPVAPPKSVRAVTPPKPANNGAPDASTQRSATAPVKTASNDGRRRRNKRR